MRFRRQLILALLAVLLMVAGSAVAQTATPLQPCGSNPGQNPVCADGYTSITVDFPWLAISGNGTPNPVYGWRTDLTSTNPTQSVVWVQYQLRHVDGIHAQQASLQLDSLQLQGAWDSVDTKLEPASGPGLVGATHVLHVIAPTDWSRNFINGTVGGSVIVVFYSLDTKALLQIAAKPMVREKFYYLQPSPNGWPTPMWQAESIPGPVHMFGDNSAQSLEPTEWIADMVASPASQTFSQSRQVADFAVKNVDTVNPATVNVWIVDSTGQTGADCLTQVAVAPGAAYANEIDSLLPASCFPDPSGLVGQLHIQAQAGGNVLVWFLQLFGLSGTGLSPF